MKTTLQAAVLEISHRQDKKDPKKVYNSLVCFEFGRDYPELTKINLTPEQIPSARALIGRVCDLELELRVGRDFVTTSFISGHVRPDAKAA
jgi:hypothetical protein